MSSKTANLFFNLFFNQKKGHAICAPNAVPKSSRRPNKEKNSQESHQHDSTGKHPLRVTHTYSSNGSGHEGTQSRTHSLVQKPQKLMSDLNQPRPTRINGLAAR
ncbi:MAG: hypothetical protein WCS09_09785 [Pseudomonadota bacterium]